MRLWSIHPCHLDAKGLVALWREGLLARAVLSGATRGYRAHPQLIRFRRRRNPIAAVDAYLRVVVTEAEARGYHFDAGKLGEELRVGIQPVGAGQVAFEWKHLLSKLHRRDRARWYLERRREPLLHPSFRSGPGGIEAWEVTT